MFTDPQSFAPHQCSPEYPNPDPSEIIKALQDNDQFLDVVQKLPVMVAAVDGYDRIQVWNRKCEAVTGYPAPEVIGSATVFEKLYPDQEYRQEILGGWRECNFDFQDVETWAICRNSEKCKIKWSSFPAGRAHPTLSTIIGIHSFHIENSPPVTTVSVDDDPGISELFERNQKFELLLNELMDTNQALSELARNIENEKDKAEKKMMRIINSDIMPILETLRKCETFEDYRSSLENLNHRIMHLTSSLTTETNTIFSLSLAESQVATMISCGLKSQEIADQLCISLNTVKTHRRNIRKKLQIKNTSVNLNNYLKHKIGFDHDS